MQYADKLVLSISEASKYSGIGRNTLYELVKEPDCPFVLRVKSHYKIKRKEFEAWLSKQYSI
ncbi:MAG: helix-turn-helix domain-containing protein [Firmicutes bacterium]|nr:helix-turn-helix domain-containing protein [Bacillota bacterium]